jgi:hypothetical protein
MEDKDLSKIGEVKLLTLEDARELIYGPEDPVLTGVALVSVGLLSVLVGMLMLAHAAKE